MTWTNKGKCLDLSGGNQADGNRVCISFTFSYQFELTSRSSQIQIWTCRDNNANQVWNTGYMVNNLPATSQDGQYGTNNCGTGTSQTSKCQTAWIKYGLSPFATVGVVTDFVERNSQLCKRLLCLGTT